jgi:hypothetical protein
VSALVEEPWSLGRRVAFRALFAYCLIHTLHALTDGLYGYPLPLTDTGPLWVGKHILGLRGDIPIETTGSGDRTVDYLRCFCSIVLAAAATLVWSLADRRRAHYATLREWLRVLVRYALAAIMLFYGLAKVGQIQFSAPNPERLLEPYGESSPMGLAWTFLGYSTVYQVFGGFAETAGALLLFFRRTTTLGAALLGVVLTNVVLINFCYDVPVKLGSTHLLLASIYLLAPDARRLANVLFLQRPTSPPEPRPGFSRAGLRRGAFIAKALVIGVMLSWPVYTLSKPYQGVRTRPALYGAYAVESFVRSGAEVPPLLTDASRWRTCIVDRRGGLTIRKMDDSRASYALKDDAGAGELVLTSKKDKEMSVKLSYARPDADHLTLQGTWDEQPILVRLRRVDESKILLVNRGFHWINESPLNR